MQKRLVNTGVKIRKWIGSQFGKLFGFKPNNETMVVNRGSKIEQRIVKQVGKLFDLGLGDALVPVKFMDGGYAILIWLGYIKSLSIWDIKNEQPKHVIYNSVEMPTIEEANENEDFCVRGRDKIGKFLVKIFFNIKYDEQYPIEVCR